MLTKRAHCIIRQNPFSVLASVIMSDTQQDREDRLLHKGELQGFSFIELLVVVAIIGVVTVVGIAGYQRYIENTRADVAKNNAQSVERWLSYAHIARSGGLTVDPAECGTDQTGGLEDCFDDLASDAKPFNKFKNPYQPASTANPILVYMDNETSFIDAEDDCTSLNASLGVSSREGSSATAPTDWSGVVLIQLLTASDLLSKTSNRIRVGWCNKDEELHIISDNISF